MKKLLVFVLTILLLSSIVVLADVPDENYELVFSDEFDSEIDPVVWSYRLGGRAGAGSFHYPENVSVKNGRMYQEMRFEMRNGVEELTGGGIISNDLFGYGYYETKSTLASASAGLHSSFWSMGFGGDGEKYPKYNQVYEIDGYEVDSYKPNQINCSQHCYIGGLKSYGKGYTDTMADQEFIMGYEWLPNEINWYINGKLVQTRKGEDLPIRYAQQNIWITALSQMESKSWTMDRSKLPQSSSWDYVRFYAMPLKDINLISANEFEYNTNPGFTTNLSMQHPVAWMEKGDIKASMVEKSESAISGNNVLAHRSDKDYAVTTAQKLYYIANGNYNFEVYAMSSGGQKTAKVRISGFDGDKVVEKDIPQSDKMQKITIEGIEIKDNGAYIEIISEATKDQWLLIDDPSLYCTHGKEVEKALPFVIDLGDETFGEYAVERSEEGFTSEGEWQNSGVSGYNGKKSLFVYGGSDAYAKFELTAPKDGDYEVNFYKVFHANSAKNAHVYYEYNGKITEKNIDLTVEGGWEPLGNVTLKKGEKVYVVIDSKNGGTLRASAAALFTEDSITPKEVIILRPDHHKAYTDGKKVSIDANNFEIVPKVINDRTMVPIRFIAEALGATVSYKEETEEIVIDIDGKQILLKVGSDVMKVGNTEVKLDAPAFVEDGRTLVPVRAISEGLGKKVSYLEAGFVIIGNKNYKDTTGLADYLSGLY